MRSLAVVVALLLVPVTASAQPSLTSPAIEPGDKDPTVATLAAFGGMIAGFAVFKISADNDHVGGMIAGGVLLAVGPSAGHIYAGQVDRVVGGTLVRAAGLGLVVAGAKQFAEGFFEDNKNPGSGLLVMVLGGAVYTLMGTLDVVDAPKAARRRNAERRLGFAPGYARTANGDGVPTAGLTGRF